MRIPATKLMPDFSGLSLDHGRYRLFENVGRGAYGKVYRATDMSHRSSKKQALAVKCLRKPTDSCSYLSHKRELEHHKLVSGHPNIVTFHRCFSDGQFVYVVLDFCNGGDLFSAITKKHLFHGNTSLIKSAFVQLIDAVAHCHRHGVFHRDLKPENILCSDDGSDIRLADFGLSIMSPYSKDFNCGSSHYMSPECLGKQLYCREYATSYNDIWALGVILTNMITVRNPWECATPEDNYFAAYLMDNSFLKKILPISDGVNDILTDIFIVNPARRLTLTKMRSRILALDATSDTLNGQPDLSLAVADVDSLTVPLFDSSGSSAPESNGPVTPPTPAVDVGIFDIPGISREVLGDSISLQKSSVIQKPQDVMASVKARRPGDIFRAAVRRIKVWYKADPVA